MVAISLIEVSGYDPAIGWFGIAGRHGSTAEKVQSNTDDAVEDHFKAVIAAHHWEKEEISFQVYSTCGATSLRTLEQWLNSHPFTKQDRQMRAGF